MIPVVSKRSIDLPQHTRAGLQRITEQLRRNDPNLASDYFTSHNVAAGHGGAAQVLIGDRSEIRFLTGEGSDTLEYRIAVLAGEGDIMLLASRRCLSFERYLQDLLCLTDESVLELPPTGGLREPVAHRCVRDRSLNDKLLTFIKDRGGATLVPYLVSGSVWRLARSLSAASGKKVFVAGPPPNLSQSVNDKIWFSDLVKTVLSVEATPPAFAAYGPAALAGHVMRLADKWERLVIKVPDSAGSAGNFPLQTETVRGLGAKAVRDKLMSVLSPFADREIFPLMVEVWDCNVMASPSVQIWIPNQSEGDPIIEGVFDQFVCGEAGKFAGAKIARLPGDLDRILCRDALTLALVLQALGYFGRCSFDTVVVGTDWIDARIHWIECNGRWGGVSLPLSLMNRLFEPEDMPEYLIVQHADSCFEPMGFDEALTAFADKVYRPGGGPEGVIFLSPGGIESGTGVQIVSIAPTLADAHRLSREVISILEHR